MGLESATYISDLVPTNPDGDDGKNAGDNHVRMVKLTLQNSFPNVIGAMNATTAELNLLVGTVGFTGQSSYGVDSGVADAYTTEITPTATSYTDSTFWVKIAATSTGASTLNVDSLGVKNIKRLDGTDVGAGDIQAAGIHGFAYDGTNFILLNAYTVDFDAGQVNYTVKLLDGGTPDYLGNLIGPSLEVVDDVLDVAETITELAQVADNDAYIDFTFDSDKEYEFVFFDLLPAGDDRLRMRFLVDDTPTYASCVEATRAVILTDAATTVLYTDSPASAVPLTNSVIESATTPIPLNGVLTLSKNGGVLNIGGKNSSAANTIETISYVFNSVISTVTIIRFYFLGSNTKSGTITIRERTT